MEWARRYALRNIAYAIPRDASYYGSGLYGEGTYGQEASTPLSNIEYVLAAAPGEWPALTDWVYRVGDSGVWFRAVALGLDGLMDLSAVLSAVLVLDRAGSGPDRLVKAFALTVDPVEGGFSYQFLPGDLSEQGVYRALVQLTFNSGRTMTIAADDSTTFLIRGVD